MNYRLAAAVRRSTQQRHGVPLDVLVFIAECADPDGTNAWPSVETIAKHCKCSERAVQYALRALVAAGELTVEPRTDDAARARPRVPNRYSVTLPADYRADVIHYALGVQRGEQIAPDLKYYLERGYAAQINPTPRHLRVVR